MKRVTYTVVVEPAGSNYSAFVPDLPGCVATGLTVEETVDHIREAIQFHLEGLLEDGQEPPPASASSVAVEAEIPG
ncbi:MAG TPA: type II toxin-antitoxin system HicB family antitoxin [Phycisphaerae bacterium]|nr:type II toxin-antitoxin system HicB family antitoxin [Phycisphaerae bacterium]HNU44305.1 type II toxin-antitoxin system HicB family antitoxin [Phycisphaerae bacterium]